MKEWVPNRDFKKADFGGSKKTDNSENIDDSKSQFKKNPTEPKINITTDLTPDKVVKAWLPPSIDEVANKKNKRPPVIEKSSINPTNTKEIHKTTNTELQRSAQRTSLPKIIEPVDSRSNKSADSDMSGQLLDELIIARPIEATDLLRSWYWQKSSGGTTPQTKIYVILHSIRKDTLVELYGYFSALERRQMHEIFSKKRTVVKNEVLQARSEFMSKLSLSFG
ncbi:MAG: hypothetical protein H3C43_04615 [Leptonema sp. (in: Bacteria)]|nr:hypothetical protein [Leptonema sp. (in: bacteria)]